MATPTGPIRTQVDFELQHAPRGKELADGVAQRLRDRGQGVRAERTALPSPSSDAFTLTWADFQQRSPEWRGEYWAECRALYAGGDRLLGDKAVLERLFPKHVNEAANIYDARKARAHYYPYAGTIIDHLLAGLGTDPLRITFGSEDKKTGVRTIDPAAKWWERWVSDVTDTAERPSDYGLEDDDDEDDDEGGTTMHQFIVDVLREAMQTRTAWVLADLPEADPEARALIDSKLAAEQSGLDDPYLSIVPAEQVIDWQADNRGRLQWAMVMTQEQIRSTPKQRRGIIRHTYVLWDAEMWAKYVIDVDPTNPPQQDQPFQPVNVGDHSFGRVPLERLTLPEGMHAMGKLHSLAREHLNKRCAMSWAEYKSLFAVLYEYLGPEDNNGLPVAEAQTDGGRATNQIRGQGYTQTRGKDDRAEYVGPEVAPFKEARESCNDAMREMHRVMFSMALSANMDAAALSRSGDSKEKDNASTAVLLDAFGVIARKFMRRLLVLASLGRSEAVPSARTEGLEQFDVAGTTEAIAEAVELFNGVPILSPLFKELYLARLYGRTLGEITQEQMVEIRKEIRDHMAAEEAAMAMGLMPGTAGNTNTKPGAPGGDEPPDVEEDDEERAPPAKPIKGKGPTGYSSARPKR